ncbi:MAG: FRG domain-containing protein [Anaerolineaceae bacterium]|nr:FRG domain-containing protein [Anaerolineaceae bacterium]
MTEEIILSNWTDFSVKIEEIKEKYLGNQIGSRVEKISPLLFRGQENASWPITTTLERKVDGEYELMKYMELVLSYSHEIEVFKGKNKWNLPDFLNVESEILEKQYISPYIDYLIYMRQFGFPSPLLDWTLSPNIAAYFAVSGQKADESSAVYVYIEKPSGNKGFWVASHRIIVIDSRLGNDRRHLTQQACYTIATIWKDNEKRHYFSSHNHIFSKGSTHQDILIKIIIPPLVRKNALIALNHDDINHYTLFDTEDALIKTMAMKAFDL